MRSLIFQFAAIFAVLCAATNISYAYENISLQKRTYVAGEYNTIDYERYPAYKSIIIESLSIDNQGPPKLAYILQDQKNIVCIFGDACGDISYVAYCYILVDTEHFKKIGEIKYINRKDFDIPELRKGYLNIRSKGSKTKISFDINQNALYSEDIQL